MHKSPSLISRVFPGLNAARFREEWAPNVRVEILAGIAVALALIPEAIAFSLIANVSPQVGLYASFSIAVMAAIFGGRPGMISGATGAVALLVVPLVAQHGIEYLFAATILTGLFQLVFRALRLSRYIRFVPRPVMSGFVNALAILIFMAQLPQIIGAGIATYGLIAAGLFLIYLVPRWTRVIPAPLVAIVVLTAVSLAAGLRVPTVGDMGSLPTSLPLFHLPTVPFNFETLRITAPYALSMALVGLIESLLTAKVVDEMTDTPSCKHSEALGQGMANIVTGFFGGMAGCAMIGQSVINVQSGGRGRLSSLSAGVFLLLFVVLLGDWVSLIPTGALVALMITVSIGTFDLRSVREMSVLPLPETLIMVCTVATVVISHDLSLGVMVGVLMSSLLFARHVGKLVTIESKSPSSDRQIYVVRGQLFFVSVEQFVGAFDMRTTAAVVEIDLTHAHIWDASAVAALDRVVLKFRSRGSRVTLTGLNEASTDLLGRLATYDRPGADLALGH